MKPKWNWPISVRFIVVAAELFSYEFFARFPNTRARKITCACLHGLTRAVEKEAGKLSKVLASVTRVIVIGLMRWSVVRCPLSLSPVVIDAGLPNQ
jgi:hypothetical protein